MSNFTSFFPTRDPIWGNVEGTLADQLDLNSALALKQNISGLGALAFLGTVGTPQINNLAITNAKIADNAVNAAKMANNAVTTAKVNDNAITTAKVANNAITNAKIDTMAYTKLTGIPTNTPVTVSLLNSFTAADSCVLIDNVERKIATLIFAIGRASIPAFGTNIMDWTGRASAYNVAFVGTGITTTFTPFSIRLFIDTGTSILRWHQLTGSPADLLYAYGQISFPYT